MRRRIHLRGTLLFAVVTVFLVTVTAFCTVGTVMSKSDMGGAQLQSYYHAKEQELLRLTREELRELGYRDSGVTLTRVTDESGNREYTFSIHHGRIHALSSAEREALEDELLRRTGLNSGVERSEAFWQNCTFCHDFLMDD